MIDLKEYGYSDFYQTDCDNGDLIPARVTEVQRELYQIVCAYGEFDAKLKTSVYYNPLLTASYPTVGDFVLFQRVESGTGLIMKTLPRKSFFSRKDPDVGHGEQMIAANFDYVFIMTSLNHDFNLKRIERYLTAAWQSGGIPVIILTKADLMEDYEKMASEAAKIATCVSVCAVSAQTGLGLSSLSEYLQPGKTIAFLGSSGVGKSSLINALAGEEIMQVSGIREDDSKGRHTTTHRQLIRLKSGVMMIDTPGMRELGMWDVREGLGEAFTDVEQLLLQCRFSDCSHSSEPGCAINEAIQDGRLSQERWNSYQKLKKEARYADDKASYLRQKQEWHKSIAKLNKKGSHS